MARGSIGQAWAAARAGRHDSEEHAINSIKARAKIAYLYEPSGCFSSGCPGGEMSCSRVNVATSVV